MSRALLILDSPSQRQKAMGWISKAPYGTRVEFKEAKRSDDQNAKMWAMLTEVAQQCRHHEIKLSPDDWKLLFLDALKREVRMIPNLDATGIVSLGRSSSDLSKQEMSDLIELIFEYGARNGVKFKGNEHEPSEAPPQANDAGSGIDASPDDPAADNSQIDAPPGEKIRSTEDATMDAGPVTDESSVGSASPSIELNAADLAWLKLATRMLWAATGINEIDVLKAQVAGIVDNETPPEISRAARDRFNAIFKRCKAVCFGEADSGDTLVEIAAIAGCETREVVS